MSRRRQIRFMDVIVYGDDDADMLEWIEYLAQEGATIDRIFSGPPLTYINDGVSRVYARAHVVYSGPMLLLGAVWARYNVMRDVNRCLYLGWNPRERIHRERPLNLFAPSDNV